MAAVFWISAAIIVYTYVGFPLCLRLLAYFSAKPVRKGEVQPSVTIAMAVHNEQEVLTEKLSDMLSRYNYPSKLLEFIVVSDGSTDRTNEILLSTTDPRLKVIVEEKRRGKAAAISKAIMLASHEIVVFVDARQWIDPGAIRSLVRNFADSTVGCVGGSLCFRENPSHNLGGEATKMDIENKIRRLEGQTGSTVGALGALYAVRRELLGPVPEGTILDDCYTPLSVVRRGYRCVYEEQAVAWDSFSATSGQEFRRKIRTITGLYQLMRLMPWLMDVRNSFFWRFFSHKFLRLVMPLAHVLLFVSAALLIAPFYRLIFLVQLAFLGLGAVALIIPTAPFVKRPASIALTMIILNCAAVIALLNFLTRRKIAWAGA